MLNQRAKIFTEDLAQVVGDHALFASSEDEFVELECFLAEPKLNGFVDGILSYDEFSLQKCFSGEGSSAADYGHVKKNNDVLGCSLTLGEKAKNGFLDRKLEGNTDELADETNSLQNLCEDYLLDTEFESALFNGDCVPSEGSHMENWDANHNSGDSCEIQCGAEKLELSDVNIPMLEDSCDQKSSLLDKMTIEELHNTFRNMFGRDTAVRDQQWLMHHISFALQNDLHELGNGFSFTKNYATDKTENYATAKSNDTESDMVLSTSNEYSMRECSLLTHVFTFRTKPRARNVKKGENASYDHLKTFSAGVSELTFGLAGVEEENIPITKIRSRKPTQRYIEEFAEHSLKHRMKKYGSPHTYSEGKILPKVPDEQQHFRNECGATVLVSGKEPLGLLVGEGHPKKMDSDSETEDSRVLGSNGDSDVDLYSIKSQDDVSEDDCISWLKRQKAVKGRRKKHKLWSLPEVLKLVEGVSKYGVGRWTEIKRLLFPSATHRSSVDLKDKWRNLLRASSKFSNGKGGDDQVRKHASQLIPRHILRHVGELSVMYPYPKERKLNVSHAASRSSSLMPALWT